MPDSNPAGLIVVPNGSLTFSRGMVATNMNATTGHVFAVTLNVKVGSAAYTAAIRDLTAGLSWNRSILTGRTIVAIKSYFNIAHVY